MQLLVLTPIKYSSKCRTSTSACTAGRPTTLPVSEAREGGLTGGIQVNGNYPGKARNIEELRSDILYAMSLIPGKHRLNLHEIYGDFQGKFVDRDQVTPEHFQSWIEWGKTNDIKLDFNSTSFSHPRAHRK